MRRLCIVLSLGFIAGCSTHPLVDTCDFLRPGHLYPTQKGLTPYGGTCIPQGVTFQGTTPSAPFGPVVPPPVPLPPATVGPPRPITVPTIPPGGGAPPPNMAPF